MKTGCQAALAHAVGFCPKIDKHYETRRFPVMPDKVAHECFDYVSIEPDFFHNGQFNTIVVITIVLILSRRDHWTSDYVPARVGAKCRKRQYFFRTKESEK
jgi:hypothetical protein